MKIICPSCETPLNLPDDRVPKGRPFNFTCPKCKEKNTITIAAENGGENSVPTASAGAVSPPAPADIPKPPPIKDLPPATVPPPNPWQPDTGPAGQARAGGASMLMDDTPDASKVALLAVNEGPLNDNLLEQLEAMNYMITASYGMRDALRQLKLSSFDLVVIGGDFDGAQGDNHPLIKALQLMEMDIRRRMYVVLIGSEYRTLDGFTAYGLSVNAVINDQDVEQFDKALISGQVHQKRFYQAFLNLLDKRSLL